MVSSPVTGRSGVPSTVVAADKLPQAAVTADKKMGGDLQAANCLEIRVGIPIELVGKELRHLRAAIGAWWQADGVHHQQVYAGLRWAGTEIGRGLRVRRLVPTAAPQRLGEISAHPTLLA